MSLTTGKKLSRQQWDQLPMPDGVIARVENMALDQDQPLLGNGTPFFEWAPGFEIMDAGAALIILDDNVPEQMIDGEVIEAIEEEGDEAEDLVEDEFEYDDDHKDDTTTGGE